MSNKTKPSFSSISKTVESALADLEKVKPSPAGISSRDAARFLTIAIDCEE